MWLIRIVRGAVIVYVAVGILLVAFERSYVYFPNIPDSPTFDECRDFPEEVERIEYDGVRIFYQPLSREAVHAPHIAVLYHGNAGSACDRSFFSNTFLGAGYSYIVVEYPGYGGDPNPGPSKKRILAATHAVQRFLEERGYTNVTLVGESLGVGVALYHAAHYAPVRMVLISPYYRLSDGAGWIGWVYPAGLLMRENYTAGVWAAEVAAPALVIRAGEDEIFPRRSAARLFDALGGEKTFVEVAGATHNQLYGYTEFHTAITEFLKDTFDE